MNESKIVANEMLTRGNSLISTLNENLKKSIESGNLEEQQQTFQYIEKLSKSLNEKKDSSDPELSKAVSALLISENYNSLISSASSITSSISDMNRSSDELDAKSKEHYSEMYRSEPEKELRVKILENMDKENERSQETKRSFQNVIGTVFTLAAGALIAGFASKNDQLPKSVTDAIKGKKNI